jgi:ribosome recycling factor
MINDVQKDLSGSIGKAHEALKRELVRLRAGRASSTMLEGLKVDYYGTPTPLTQMAHINVPEPRLITVKPWDKTQIKAVDKALRESDLGLNPQIDGDLVRIPLPPLTEERRKEFVKIARKYGEVDRAKKKVEEVVQDAVKQVDTMIAHKEKDILEV